MNLAERDWGVLFSIKKMNCTLKVICKTFREQFNIVVACLIDILVYNFVFISKNYDFDC